MRVSDRDAFGNPIAPSSPPPPAQPVGQAPAPPAFAPPVENGSQATTLGWVSLALGIGGLITLPIVLSIPAVILGLKARRDTPSGQSNAPALTGVVLGALGLLIFLTFIAVFLVAIASGWSAV